MKFTDTENQNQLSEETKQPKAVEPEVAASDVKRVSSVLAATSMFDDDDDMLDLYLDGAFKPMRDQEPEERMTVHGIGGIRNELGIKATETPSVSDIVATAAEDALEESEIEEGEIIELSSCEDDAFIKGELTSSSDILRAAERVVKSVENMLNSVQFSPSETDDNSITKIPFNKRSSVNNLEVSSIDQVEQNERDVRESAISHTMITPINRALLEGFDPNDSDLNILKKSANASQNKASEAETVTAKEGASEEETEDGSKVVERSAECASKTAAERSESDEVSALENNKSIDAAKGEVAAETTSLNADIDAQNNKTESSSKEVKDSNSNTEDSAKAEQVPSATKTEDFEVVSEVNEDAKRAAEQERATETLLLKEEDVSEILSEANDEASKPKEASEGLSGLLGSDNPFLGMNPSEAIEAARKALEQATQELNASRRSSCESVKVSREEGDKSKREEASEKADLSPVAAQAPQTESAQKSEVARKAPLQVDDALVSLKSPHSNIEMHSQLTNMTGQLVGQRPEWLDFDMVKLPDREKECKRLYWQIEKRQAAQRKDIIVIRAPEGAGKTSFLAGLYAQLMHSTNDIVTIAPAQSKTKRPFSAIRNILEQRFYIIGNDVSSTINQLKQAVQSVLSSELDAEETSEKLRSLWQRSQMSRSEYRNSEIINMKPSLKLEVTALMDLNGNIIHQPSASKKQPSGAEKRITSMESMIHDAMAQEHELAEVGENGPTYDVEQEVFPYIAPIREIFQADLKKNRIVILFDDIEQYDEESLTLLARVYDDLEACPFTLILTMNETSKLPKALNEVETTDHEFRSLSDEDLTGFTRRILEQLSKQREKLIIPTELCKVVAQHACGSPKRAMDLMMKHFTPDQMLSWNENLETLRHEPVPESLLATLKHRLLMLSERERTVLCVASILNGEPFTADTIDAVINDKTAENTGIQSKPYLENLNKTGFLSTTKIPLLQNTVTYIFKHEYERQAITSFVSRDIRRRVYAKAAQWYTLNNPDNRFNETIGDLWFALSEQSRAEGGKAPATDQPLEVNAQEEFSDTIKLQANISALEAAHYYERVAYSALSKAQYMRARKLFKKLLKALPSDNVARCIQAVLDASLVYMRLGNIEDAMRLAHSAWRHAERFSAYSMAAAAASRVAEILIMMGTPRHVKHYISVARCMLNRCMIPQLMLKTYLLELKLMLLQNRFDRAKKLAVRARAFVEAHDIQTLESLELRRYEGDIAAYSGNPRVALDIYQEVIEQAKQKHAMHLYAETHHAMGTLQFRLEENDLAFRSWNKALGLAQEMNDLSLHASLLCDIAEGAISIHAIRTARSANEQCLTLAQHLRQKELIGRCLVNNASLQFEHGQYAKAERTLRKVHKISRRLGIMNLTLKSLVLMARCRATSAYEQYDPKRAGILYSRVNYLYEKRGMKLELATMQPQYASYFIETKQNIQAKNAYKRAHDIFESFNMTKAARSVEEEIERILRESDVAGPDAEC